MNIKATLTFDKQNNKDLEALQLVKDTTLSYNFLSLSTGGDIIPSEECDCGDTIELRFDYDYDTTRERDSVYDLLNSMGKIDDTYDKLFDGIDLSNLTTNK